MSMQGTTKPPGTQARIATLLKDLRELQPDPVTKAEPVRRLSISEIMTRLDMNKTQANEVSAALSKLRGKGEVKCTSGPTHATRGRAFVKYYEWVPKRTGPQIVYVGDDPRRMLGIGRLA